MIFRDPTTGIVVSALKILPAPISSDRLHGMLDRVSRRVTKVVIVLAAVHGLRPTDIVWAKLADLDLSAGRLVIRRARPTRRLLRHGEALPARLSTCFAFVA